MRTVTLVYIVYVIMLGIIKKCYVNRFCDRVGDALNFLVVQKERIEKGVNGSNVDIQKELEYKWDNRYMTWQWSYGYIMDSLYNSDFNSNISILLSIFPS